MRTESRVRSSFRCPRSPRSDSHPRASPWTFLFFSPVCKGRLLRWNTIKRTPTAHTRPHTGYKARRCQYAHRVYVLSRGISPNRLPQSCPSQSFSNIEPLVWTIFPSTLVFFSAIYVTVLLKQNKTPAWSPNFTHLLLAPGYLTRSPPVLGSLQLRGARCHPSLSFPVCSCTKQRSGRSTT